MIKQGKDAPSEVCFLHTSEGGRRLAPIIGRLS